MPTLRSPKPVGPFNQTQPPTPQQLVNILGEVEQLRQVVIDLHRWVNSAFSVQSGDYTTTGEVRHETVICDATTGGTQTITLHSPPADGDLVTVKRVGTEGVTVATAGSENIDGASTDSIASQYDSHNFLYIADKTEWYNV